MMLKHRTGKRRLIENDAEAAAAYARTFGALKSVPRKGFPPVIVSSKDPGFRALAGVLYPPEPLTSLFLSGISYDALFHCVRMMDIARRGATDATAAPQRALVYSAPYISAEMSRRQLT